MALQEARFCPVCYEIYVDRRSIKTEEPIPRACLEAREIRGASETDVTGLVLKNQERGSALRGSALLQVIVLRDNNIIDSINRDFPRSQREITDEVEILEPTYLGVSMSGPFSKRGLLPLEDTTLFGEDLFKDYIKDANFVYNSGLDEVPLRKLWGGHGYYARATEEDLARLKQAILKKRFPSSWNESVPFDKLHISPNPFLD